MRMSLRYHGASGVKEVLDRVTVLFAPNLARPKVFFDAELARPVRFREAVSALHDVVVGDLAPKKKDRTVYEQYKASQASEEETLRRAVEAHVKREELERLAKVPVSPDLEQEFLRLHGVYWKARRKWADELRKRDPALFRALVPCDPVVTVASDAVLFECFSKDESAYGCLSVDRGAFRSAGEAGLGTTNVDYSLALYDHFQTLRSYRPTRLLVDPTGFEVRSVSTLREEQIDLPNTWLRGFGQLQAALTHSGQRVRLTVEALYSLLSILRRRRERQGPRSLRFVLERGRPVRVVVEPWGLEVMASPMPYDGPGNCEIRVWGRRRLLSLTRLLPLADSAEVTLLGSGLPSVWVIRAGELSFVLALSGWSANNLTSGTGLDACYVGRAPHSSLIDAVRARLEQQRSATEAELRSSVGSDPSLAAALHVLAQRGQVAYDFAAERYRYRPIMPFELSEQVLGPPPPEQVEGVALAQHVQLDREEALDGAKRLFVAKVKETRCEALLDADGNMSRARCSCSHFYKYRLRAGPCRHLLALRLFVQSPVPIQALRAEG